MKNQILKSLMLVIVPVLAKGEVLLNHYGVGEGFDAIHIEYTSCSPVNVTTSPDHSGEILEVAVDFIVEEDLEQDCQELITKEKIVYLEGREALFHISNPDTVSVEMDGVLPVEGRFTTQEAQLGGISRGMSPVMRSVPRTATNVSVINKASLQALQSRNGITYITTKNKTYAIASGNIISASDPRYKEVMKSKGNQTKTGKGKTKNKNNNNKQKDKKQKSKSNKDSKKSSGKKSSSQKSSKKK